MHPVRDPARQGVAMDTGAQKQRCQHGYQRKREYERAAESENDRQRHRPKHLSFDFVEAQDRKVHDYDYPDCEDDRAQHFSAGLEYTMSHRGAGPIDGGKPPMDVLHHDNRAVDDEAEVNCAETHEISRYTHPIHPDEGREHRQRDDYGDDQASPDIAQEEEKQYRDHDRAFGKIVRDSADRALDEIGAVIVRNHLHPSRQIALDLRKLGFDSGDDGS